MATNQVNDTQILNINVGAVKSSGDPHMVGPLSCVLQTDTEVVGGLNMADVEFSQKLNIYDLSVVETAGGGVAVGDVIYYDTVTGLLNNNPADKEYGMALEVVGIGATTVIEVALFPGIEA